MAMNEQQEMLKYLCDHQMLKDFGKFTRNFDAETEMIVLQNLIISYRITIVRKAIHDFKGDVSSISSHIVLNSLDYLQKWLDADGSNKIVNLRKQMKFQAPLGHLKRSLSSLDAFLKTLLPTAKQSRRDTNTKHANDAAQDSNDAVQMDVDTKQQGQLDDDVVMKNFLADDESDDQEDDAIGNIADKGTQELGLNDQDDAKEILENQTTLQHSREQKVMISPGLISSFVKATAQEALIFGSDQIGKMHNAVDQRDVTSSVPAFPVCQYAQNLNEPHIKASEMHKKGNEFSFTSSFL